MVKKIDIRLIFLSVFLIVNLAHGEAVQQLEEVVVTATRTAEPADQIGSAVTVIMAEQMEQQKAHTVLDVLRSLSGVHVVRTGTLGKTTSLFLRGSNADHALIMLDGVQMNNSTLGAFEWTNLTVDNLSRIEIVRGPQSTLYGSDALGGVINIIIRKGSGKPKIQLHARASSQKVLTERATVGGGSNKVTYSVAASRTDSSGLLSVDTPIYRDPPEGEEDVMVDRYVEGDYGNDDYDNTTVSGRISYQFSEKVSLDSVGRFYRGAGGIPGRLVLSPDGVVATDFDRNAHQTQNDGMGLVSLNAKLLENLQSRLNLSVGVLSTAFEDLKDPNEEKTFEVHSKINGNILTADWQNTLRVPVGDQIQNKIVFGAEIENQNAKNTDELKGTENFDESVTNFAIYAQERLSWANQFFLTVGTRLDHHSNFGTVLNPRITGAYLMPQTGTKFRASFGTGFRAPTFNDLFFPNYGDPELEPEESTSFDLGIDQVLLDGKVGVGATYFQNEFDNLIAAELVDPENFVSKASNIESAETRGVEVNATLQPLDSLAVMGSYTYVDAKDTSDPNEAKPLRRRAKHTGRLQLNYALPVGLAFNLDTVFVGERPDRIPGVQTRALLNLPSYTTINLAASYVLGESVSIFGKIANLTNENYQELVGYPTLGRQFIGGTSVTF